MASFREVEGKLKNMVNKSVQVKEIVQLIQSIDSIKTKNALLLAKQENNPYDLLPQYNPILEDCQDMFIDFKYQRYLRLMKLLKHLESNPNHEFIASRAAAICARTRTNGEVYIWDGFRRAVLAGLKGIPKIPVINLPHKPNLTISEQRSIEAADFASFNAHDTEGMLPDEVWKADYIAGVESAKELALILEDCNLNVLDVLEIPNAWSLGGFKVFQTSAVGNSKIDRKYLIQASKIIQSSMKTKSVKGYCVVGIAKYLEVLDSLLKDCEDKDNTLDCEMLELIETPVEELIEYMTDFANKGRTQENIVSPSQSNRQIESAAFNFFRKVVKPNVTDLLEKKKYVIVRDILVEQLGLDLENFGESEV